MLDNLPEEYTLCTLVDQVGSSNFNEANIFLDLQLQIEREEEHMPEGPRSTPNASG